jgi:hypothetical protein
MMFGKIIPNIADFEAEQENQEGYNDESDSDSFYTSESSEAFVKPLQSSLFMTSYPPTIASDGQSYSTALPPPPRCTDDVHKKLIFVPSDALGTCP